MKKIWIFILISLCVLTGCGKKEEKKEELKMNHFTSSDIVADTFLLEDEKLMIHLSNTSSTMIDLLDIDVAFYNAEGELLKTGDAFLKNILSKKEGYTTVDLPKDESGKVIPSVKIDVKVHENKYEESLVENYIDKIKVSYTKDKQDENKLNLKIENTSEKVLDEVEIIALFKENGKIKASISSYFMNLAKTTDTTIYVPSILKDSESKYITYDEIDFHINHAIKNK